MQFDVMREYAWLIHDWDEYHQGWRWWRLIDCAAYYGYEFSAHDAAEDVKATLYCYKKMVLGRTKLAVMFRNSEQEGECMGRIEPEKEIEKVVICYEDGEEKEMKKDSFVRCSQVRNV